MAAGVRVAVGALRPLFEAKTLQALAPGLIPLALLPFLIPLIRLEIIEPLFGDTAVYQYTGWGIRHGMRLYKDMGMADGPFIHYFHAAMQAFVGLTDRGFREGDLVLQALGSGTMGLLLAPRVVLPPAARAAQKLAWFGLAAAVWLCWYLTLDWADTTEREAYYTLFGLLGMVLLHTASRYRPRMAGVATFAGAFLVATQMFGKPTGLGYVMLGGLSVLVDHESSVEVRRLRRRAFVLGIAGAIVVLLLAFAISGSLHGYFLWCVRIPYRGNAFLMHIDWLKVVFVLWDPYRMTAILALVAGAGALATRMLPRTAVGLVLVPPLFFFGGCLQSKGYPYHTIPIISAGYLLLIAVVAGVWERCDRPRWPAQRGLFAVLGVALLGFLCVDNVHKSPYRWNGDPNRWTNPAHEFASEERQVGRYLKEHTKPDDTVFAYTASENAHVLLFYAERRSASPFFHSFWLDPVGMLFTSEIKPDAQHLAALEALQSDIRGIACGAVEKNPPAAMAFNLLPQVFKVCPRVESMLAMQYREVDRIGSFHIYFRRPVGPRISALL